MNRRELIVGGVAMTLPVVHSPSSAEERDWEAEYWEAQRHIDELYEERQRGREEEASS